MILNYVNVNTFKQRNTSWRNVSFICFPMVHMSWTKWLPMRSTDWITTTSHFDFLQLSSTIRRRRRRQIPVMLVSIKLSYQKWIKHLELGCSRQIQTSYLSIRKHEKVEFGKLWVGRFLHDYVLMNTVSFSSDNIYSATPPILQSWIAPSVSSRNCIKL